ncbi:unnamed protein product [Caretta caretta]
MGKNQKLMLAVKAKNIGVVQKLLQRPKPGKANLILATERLKTEKKYLSKMVTKLVEENQKLLGENRHFREKITSFQSSPVPRKRVVGEIDEVKSTFTKVKKLQDLERQKVEEVGE